MKEKPSDKFGKSVKEVNDRVGRYTNPTAVSAKLLGNNLIGHPSPLSSTVSVQNDAIRWLLGLPLFALSFTKYRKCVSGWENCRGAVN